MNDSEENHSSQKEEEEEEQEEEELESVSVGDFEVDPEDAEKEDLEAGESEPSDGEDLGPDTGRYARDAQEYQPQISLRRQRAENQQAQADQDHADALEAKGHIYALANARQPNKAWNAKHWAAIDALARLTADVNVTASPRPAKALKFDQVGSPVESDHALLQHMSPYIHVLATKCDRTQPPTQGERDAINALIEIAKKI